MQQRVQQRMQDWPPMQGATTDWIHLEGSQHIMATSVGLHLAVPSGEVTAARAAMERCFAWLVEVGQRLTRFDQSSELCQLNARAGHWVVVSPMLLEVLAESLLAAQHSDGLFDPGLLPLLEALGYDRDYAEIAQREAGIEWRVQAGAARPGSWREIELDAARRRVRLPPGLRLDLGGIVKGWAADVAAERLLGEFDQVLVDVGSDMRVRGGLQPGEPWAIGVADPFGVPASEAEKRKNTKAVLTLGQGGIATSGATGRWWYRAGERQHHLIDPRTGRSARVYVDATDAEDRVTAASLIATATALAPTAAHAEIAAKVALLRGYPDALFSVEAAWAREQESSPASSSYGDDRVGLILVLGNGVVKCSTNLEAYLKAQGGGGNLWLE